VLYFDVAGKHGGDAQIESREGNYRASVPVRSPLAVLGQGCLLYVVVVGKRGWESRGHAAMRSRAREQRGESQAEVREQRG